MMSKSPTRWVASTIARRVAIGAVGFATVAHHVHATPIDTTRFDDFRSDFVCDVTEEDYNGAHYLEITLRNCGLVGRYQKEITDAINDSLHEIIDESETQRDDWLNRTAAAAAACEQAQFLLEANDFVSAANISVNAWGSIIMRGKECCVLTRPPYCIDKDWSGATAAIAVPFLILMLLLVAALLASFRKKPHKEPAELGAGSHDTPFRSAPDGQKRRQLEKQLHNEWSNQSPLRVLPHSRDFANSAASLFAALWESYNFQEASVVNQFEHLISLLRSQVAMVADRAIGEGVQVQEGELLPEALGDLHAELLNGFCRWRKKFRDHPATNMEVDDSAEIKMPTLCGAQWEPISRAAGGANAAEMSRQLAEISAFLLVWGEAGNVRFMPEVVYFLTELVLESDKAGETHSLKALYQLEARELDIVNLKSGLFLSRVIRPIYDMLFEEWYDKVDVNKDNKKDVKKLKNGLEAYIPPHVANYDDWNEFVANPDKMVEGFFQTDGTPLFQHPHGQRFKQLAKVDWGLSLEARETKTHRELHSLWGVFAAIHRVILVHTVLFFGGVITVYNGKDIPDSPDGEWVLLGQATLVRYAALGLVVPVHALAWGIAQWQVTGPALRPNCYRCECFTRRFQFLRDLCMAFFQPVCGCPESGKRTVRCLLWKPWLIFFIIPAITYGMIRYQDGKNGDYDGDDVNYNLLIVHFAVSGYLCGHLLLVPNYRYTIFPFENLTHVPILLRIIRYIFWGCILAMKFFLGMVVAQAVSDAVESLEISRPGMQSWKEITKVYFTSHWGATVLQWLIFWVTNFYLFFTDTALWYIAGCGILGMVTTVAQRHFAKNQDTCALVSFMSEDAVAKIPQRFSKKVLCYAPPGKDQLVSQKFPPIWDRICEYMRYEDKINSITMGNLSYDVEASGHQVYWEDLAQPVGVRRASATGSGTGTGPSELLTSTTGAGERKRVRVPNIFKCNTPVEGCLKTYGCVPDQDWPSNTDIQWRITALARGLGLPMPRPYRCPYMPGLTVLIPHYGEAILMQKKELFLEGKSDIVPLIDWLTHKYGQEFDDFTTRMQARAARGEPWPVVGTEWDRYTPSQWEKVNNWAAMRQQTLFRTVAGMCYYHPAIQAHFELQGDKNCSLGKIWDASDCFTCIVSMQMYVFFDRIMSEHTNYMFEKFPRCLKVAYIDYDERGQNWEKDNVHKGQKRRYYSCLIDRSCERDGMKRKPRFRIELPGYPILGDGKGDNQNHAIPFMRGHYSQCIDANQGAYFEQMMLLPNALGEFRSKKRGDNGGKKIIGFPEHITSDIGSIGDFAASAEVAFGTILQRTYSVLGARMHYGHPDIMNKLFMIQQGGVSKATKTINLSEDIFAGMDFTLRGDGRTIKHCEYFNLAKGRDLGFNTVLGFFSKLSSGTGEQILTRQVFRLGQVMHLPEALSFYYAHAGYYLTQFFVSWALPLLVFMWLLVLVSDCDDNFASVQQCDPELDANTADVMAGLLATCYSWIMLLFIFATMFPLFAELWMQRSLGFAVFKVVQSYMTMAPLLFVFQAKCIGHYVVNEFRYGGATYVATGRGLPTERRPFIGEPEARKRTVKCEPGDLRFDVDPSSGKVWTVEDGGQAKKLGVMPGHMVTKIDDMPFSKASLNRMMHGKHAYTIEIKASYLMLKKVGGLYLDYAVISYYDGAMLLFAVVLVFLAGGMPSEDPLSLIWMFISLALTIIAWLYGPFIFNPYQYEASHFRNDLRALLSFFLQDSGRHWVDWYDRTQLKAGHGLATTLVDITFFMFIFAVAAWYVAVNTKVQAFESVYSQYKLANLLYVVVLVPPVIASFAFTCVVVLLELCGGCSSTIQRNLENRVAQLREQVRRATAGKEDDELEDLDAGAEVGGKAEDVEVGAPKTGRKTTMALGETATRRLGCSVGIPLPLSAITVVVLDIVEACIFLIEFYRVGWYKGLMAGLILKLFLLSGVISLAEGVLVSRTFDKLIKCYEPLGLPLATWVRAHRMLRDILTSLLIFLPQSILVLLNTMNQCLCPTCNCHQLCLYRDPGHIKRSEQELSSLIEDQPEPLATATPPTQTGMPTATTSGTNPGASAVKTPSRPRSPNAEHSMDFKDDKGDTVLLTVNKEGGVDFYSKDVKTLKELTVVSANGRTLHMEGKPCGRWPGSWDVNTKAGEEENAQRAVALFNGEPYQPRAAPWWDFSSWFAPSEAKPTI